MNKITNKILDRLKAKAEAAEHIAENVRDMWTYEVYSPKNNRLIRKNMSDTMLRTKGLDYSNPVGFSIGFVYGKVLDKYSYDLSEALGLQVAFSKGSYGYLGKQYGQFQGFPLSRKTTKREFEKLLRKNILRLKNEIASNAYCVYPSKLLQILKDVAGEHFGTPYLEDGTVKREEDSNDGGRYNATKKDVQSRLKEMEKKNPSERYAKGKSK